MKNAPKISFILPGCGERKREQEPTNRKRNCFSNGKMFPIAKQTNVSNLLLLWAVRMSDVCLSALQSEPEESNEKD